MDVLTFSYLSVAVLLAGIGLYAVTRNEVPFWVAVVLMCVLGQIV